MTKLTKTLYTILFILIFLLGGCIGALVMHHYLRPPAYPGPGDWNGDGELTWDDLKAACHELIHGQEYPEYVIVDEYGIAQ